MRHVYECPMRWADLDPLDHVNNVVYVDYLQEARVDMMRTHAPDSRVEDLAEGVVVVRHEVTYVAPLSFRFRPVTIECWISEVRAATFTMSYEVFDETDEGRRVYLRARTVLTPYVFAAERPRRLRPEERAALQRFLEPDERPAPVRVGEVRRTSIGHYPVHVRFSDVDVYGHVNNVEYFTFLQEARISLISRLLSGVPREQRIQFVLAQVDMDYRVPILFREAPYDAWTWVSRLGRRSMTFESVLLDGDTVLAEARVVGVFFDPEAQASTEPPAAYRAAVEAAMRAPVSQ